MALGHIFILLFLVGAATGQTDTTVDPEPCKPNPCPANTFCQILPPREDYPYKCIENGYRLGNCSLNTLETCAADTKCIEKADRMSYTCKCENPEAEGDGVRKDKGGSGCKLPQKVCTTDKECPQYGFCDPTVSYCKCKDGFEGNGFNCTDIIDCPSDKCDPNAKCADFPGGFTCTCDGSRNYRGNGTVCTYKCSNDNDCDPPRGKCNKESECECRPGYTGNGQQCTDIDECANPSDHDCPEPGAYCVNTPGGFDCVCKNGYFGDGRNCKELPKNCNEVPNMVKGRVYIIDPDGTGSADHFEVECDVLFGEVVTILNPTGSFPINTKPSTTDVPIPYQPDSKDIQPLLEISGFCFQEITFDCARTFSIFPGTKWYDAYNVTHENWGTKLNQKCACGELGVCDKGCYCDGNPSNPSSVKDEGVIVDKSMLPVMRVTFNNANDYKGKIDIGPLTCMKNPAGIPKDCHEAKFVHKITKNGVYHIDVDGAGPIEPVLVWCDMTSFDHVGITEIPPKTPEVMVKTVGGENVEYMLPGDKMSGLINGSVYCEQKIEFNCKMSGLLGSDGGFVTVGSDKRKLDYFPGADGVQDACGCGATESCEKPEVTCNCNIMDGKLRKDFGLIINKTDLPVVGVSAKFGGDKTSTYKVGPLRCAGKQFGLEPNCDKYRAIGVNEDYTYFIDPDGVGPLKPFLVECKFVPNPPQGKTIVHHAHEEEHELKGLFDLNYLTVSPQQIDALKGRSTYCSQKLLFNCNKVSINPPHEILWKPANETGFRSFRETICHNGDCKCSGDGSATDEGEIIDMGFLPVLKVDLSSIEAQVNAGGSGYIKVGPMVCSEVFPTCAALHYFIKSGKGLEGEADVINGLFTIDPDGPLGVQPFEVRCQFPLTLVPASPGTDGVTPDPNNPEQPEEECFDIKYSDEQGDPISPAQIDALAKQSGKCRQELSLECISAPATGKVNFTTCDGKTQTGWAGSMGQPGCSCGLNGVCDGGRDALCNCDVGDDKLRSDSSLILSKDRNPVCQVCLNVPGKAPDAPSDSPTPMQRFKIRGLVCDGSPNLKGNCQSARSATSFSGEDLVVPVVISSGRERVPIACKYSDNPPVGAMVLNPKDPVNPPDDKDSPVNVTIKYITLRIDIIKNVLEAHEYCTQKIFFFCVGGQEIVTGGLSGYYDSNDNAYGDWSMLPANGDDVRNACDQYKELCNRCGTPIGYMVTKKQHLPVASIYLGVKGVTVVVDHVECLNIKRKCQDLMDANKLSFAKIPRTSNRFLLDPDGPGLLPPFVAKCKFYKDSKVGITEIPTGGDWVGKVNVKNVNQPGAFEIPVEFQDVSQEQARKLAQISEFCWQNIQYKCKYTPLLNDNQDPASYYYINETDQASSWGTDDNIKDVGCACGMLGTCKTPGKSCNCDAKGPMGVDQGAVTDKDVLPIKQVNVGGQTAQSEVDITLSALQCGKLPITPPRDCADAKKIGSRNSITYKNSGEYLISPNPAGVSPFMVYCDFNTYNQIPVTVVKPKFPPENPVDDPKKPVDIPYQGPEDDQIRQLILRSAYCYQAVKFDCIGTEFLKDDAFWLTVGSAVKNFFWGGGDPAKRVCACGKTGNCGGTDSYTGQRTRRCNCDTGDSYKRADAGIITQKQFLPVSQFNFGQNDKFGKANFTVGDLICSQKPISFNECDLGFHDCHHLAKCVDRADGYSCVCPKGWEGKTTKPANDAPRANGRECIDDDECSWNPCSHTATCTNTPGSFFCTCKPGFKKKNDLECIDINECKDNTHDCDQNARCENLFGSFRCACNKGYRGNGKKCRAVGECKCFGDPHCLSFDSRWLHYQGLCEYVMSQDNCDSNTKPTYQVLVKHWRKGKTKPGYYSYVQSVRIILGDLEIKLMQGRVILVGGIYRDQFINPDGVSVLKTSSAVILRAPNGLEVTWDGKDGVTVVVPENRKQTTCGLCGNYNSDPNDDWMVGEACDDKKGTVTTNFELFGNSWTVTNNSEVQCNPDCDPDVPPDPRDCTLKELIALECGKLLDKANSPFKDCLALMSDEDRGQFAFSCSYDLCVATTDFKGELCSIAEKINEECVEKYKVLIPNWRKEVEACEPQECKNNQIYKTCGPATQETCLTSQVSIPDDTTADNCNEGCFCEKGLVMDGEFCIPKDDCGCVYNNGYMKKGDVVISPDCQTQVKCEDGGQTTTSNLQCGDNQACSVQDGKPGCYCVEGFIMNTVTGQCDPDKCFKVVCAQPNTECVNGECQCKMGYTGNCNECQNVDECAIGTSSCNKIGQLCIDTPGSFRCECKAGFVPGLNTCDDIDECTVFPDRCGENSECTNTLGSYSCQCCVGYKENRAGKCIRDTSQALGGKCCACKGDKCKEPGKVCGTDHKTYNDYRSMEVLACRDNKEVKVNYPGECQGTCETVKCKIPYQTCKLDSVGKPKCGCPTCDDSNSETESETICATNKVTYTSICHMKAATCEAEVETKVEVEIIGKPCGKGNGVSQPGPWGAWGNCSESCKQGVMNRTRDVGGTELPDTESVPCFSTCPEGPCKVDTCDKPGQVCTADINNVPNCQCPICGGFPSEPVCARIGLVIQTFENECELQKAACDKEEDDFVILEPRACENKPKNCSVIRSFKYQKDNESCSSRLPINEGQCYGGCDKNGEKCCYPTKTRESNVIMYCGKPNIRTYTKKVKIIEGCSCIDNDEAERLKKEENEFVVA